MRGDGRYAAAVLTALTLTACLGGHGSPRPSIPPNASNPALALQLRPVVAVAARGSATYDRFQPTCRLGAPCAAEALLDPDGIVLEDREGQRYELGPLLADGNDVAGAAARSTAVDVKLDAAATVRFATATAEAASAPPPGNQIAVIVDGEVASAPIVLERVSDGQIQIMGGFTADRAHRLAAILGGS